jgi:hypothetical protein
MNIKKLKDYSVIKFLFFVTEIFNSKLPFAAFINPLTFVIVIAKK